MPSLNKSLQRLFYKLGDIVANNPKHCIVSSVILSLALGTGLLQANYENDLEKLYTVSNGDYIKEKILWEKYFPGNFTLGFDPSRMMSIKGWVRVIVTTPEEGNLLTTNAWKEINDLHLIINSVQITYRNQIYNYSKLCSEIRPNHCFTNEIVDLVKIMPEIETGSTRLSYPFMFNHETYSSHLLIAHLGGLEFKDEYSLSSVRALELFYSLKTTTIDDSERSDLWCGEFVKKLEENDRKWNYIKVYKHSVYSSTREQDNNVLSVIPLFTFTVCLMCTFAIASSMSRDWVRAKPLVALCGIIGAMLGTVGSCGLLSYFGVAVIGLNSAILFIMLGIGIDDSFVMLSAWMRTNRLDPVNKRLANCYSEAAVSITITTLTDMLSFYAGLLTPIQSIQLFCAYAGTSVLGVYFMQLFFFGAVLAISGVQEERNKHSVFWWIQATPKSKSGKNSMLHKWFLTGGLDRTNPTDEKDNSDNLISVFFRDNFSNFITKSWVKGVVLLMLVSYIGVATYGISHIKEGLQEEKVARDDSYLYSFVEIEKKYLRRYTQRIQVAITTPLDYSNMTIQNQVQTAIKNLCRSSEFVTGEYQENWLKGYLDFIRENSELHASNITAEQNFITTLRTEFLVTFPQYKKDIVFNADFTKIIATRYIIQTVNMSNTEDQMKALRKLREFVKNENNFEINVFHPIFSYVEQYLATRSLTLMLVSVAGAVVTIVAVLFIPNFICAMFVFFTIFLIEFGVLGFMSLWKVNLDFISVVNLIMCIGFSCDFPAHVSYNYITSSGSPSERLQNTLYSLGLPIVQGSISTLLGVSLLFTVPSYIFQVFFKIVFLIIVFSTFHALFLLPVLFQLLSPEKITEIICRKKTFFIHDDHDHNSTNTINTIAEL